MTAFHKAGERIFLTRKRKEKDGFHHDLRTYIPDILAGANKASTHRWPDYCPIQKPGQTPATFFKSAANLHHFLGFSHKVKKQSKISTNINPPPPNKKAEAIRKTIQLPKKFHKQSPHSRNITTGLSISRLPLQKHRRPETLNSDSSPISPPPSTPLASDAKTSPQQPIPPRRPSNS